MSNYQIRKASKEDAPTLSKISGDWFRDQFDGTCTLEDMDGFINECFSEQAVLEELDDPQNHYHILEQEGNPLAYIRMRPGTPDRLKPLLDTTPMELKRFYIHPEAKGTGVAQQMMDHTLDIIRSECYDTVVLSVWEYNVRAQLFYQKYGFQDTNITNDFPIGNTPQTDRWYILKMNK